MIFYINKRLVLGSLVAVSLMVPTGLSAADTKADARGSAAKLVGGAASFVEPGAGFLHYGFEKNPSPRVVPTAPAPVQMPAAVTDPSLYAHPAGTAATALYQEAGSITYGFARSATNMAKDEKRGSDSGAKKATAAAAAVAAVAGTPATALYKEPASGFISYGYKGPKAAAPVPGPVVDLPKAVTDASQYAHPQGISNNNVYQEPVDTQIWYGFARDGQAAQAAPAAEPAATADAVISACSDKVALAANGKIHFHSGSSNLTKDSVGVVQAVAGILKECSKNGIIVAGHTDSDGSETRNQSLSGKRAQTVLKALVKAGVDKERIRAVAFGESQPIAPNDTPENKKKNRRIEFTLY